MRQNPPQEWHTDVKELWESTHRDYVLQSHHVHILRLLCEQLSRARQARDVISKDGPVVADRYGVAKEHPAVSIERQASNAARLLARELNLDNQSLTAADESSRINRGGHYA